MTVDFCAMVGLGTRNGIDHYILLREDTHLLRLSLNGLKFTRHRCRVAESLWRKKWMLIEHLLRVREYTNVIVVFY